MARTSLLIRLSREDAARVHKEAVAEYRSISGYLQFVLERSIWVEQKYGHVLNALSLSKHARELIGPQSKKLRTAIHLYCTAEQAAGIREHAAKRKLSISDFVVFSLRRRWIAVDNVRAG